jgi:hypothetical protein
MKSIIVALVLLSFTCGFAQVTSVSAGNLAVGSSTLFTTNVANPTTTPALSFTLTNQALYTLFGNCTGSSAAPTFTSLSTCVNQALLAPGPIGSTTPNTVGATALTSTSFVDLANNYSAQPAFGGNYLYPAAAVNCYQTQISEPGSGFGGSGCVMIPADEDLDPGWNYGAPTPVGQTGWFGHCSICSNNILSFAAGISSALSIGAAFDKPGDINAFDLYVHGRPSWIAPADQGFTDFLHYLTEDGAPTSTIVTGGTGVTTLSLTCTTYCGTYSLNTPLIDTTAGVVTGTISGVTNSGSGINNVAVATTSFTVGVSTTGTLAANITVPRTVSNSTLQLSAASETFNLNVSTAPTTSTLISFIGLGSYYEVIRPTAVQFVSTGVYQITAIMHYSHASGTTVCVGGAVGSYIEQTAHPGYLESVMCSPGANTIWLGFQLPGGFNNLFIAGAVSMYQGGEIYGVVNPSTGQPDGAYAVVGANNAAFATSDTVKNTNNISATYTTDNSLDSINNPYAQRVTRSDLWYGTGGGLMGGGWQEFINENPSTDYQGAGGAYTAPWLIYAHSGAVLNGIALDFSPLAGSAQGVGFAANCAGSWLCSGGGPAPSATSQINPIYMEGDNGDNFSYDHANRRFTFDNNNDVAGLVTISDNSVGAGSIIAGGYTPVSDWEVEAAVPGSGPANSGVYSAATSEWVFLSAGGGDDIIWDSSRPLTLATSTATTGTGFNPLYTFSTTGDFTTGATTVGGTTFTASGCSSSTPVGGASAGSFDSGTSGTCTVTITMGNSVAAPHGWACFANDLTTSASTIKQTATTTTTVTLSGTTTSGDVVNFACTGY